MVTLDDDQLALDEGFRTWGLASKEELAALQGCSDIHTEPKLVYEPAASRRVTKRHQGACAESGHLRRLAGAIEDIACHPGFRPPNACEPHSPAVDGRTPRDIAIDGEVMTQPDSGSDRLAVISRARWQSVCASVSTIVNASQGGHSPSIQPSG